MSDVSLYFHSCAYVSLRRLDPMMQSAILGETRLQIFKLWKALLSFYHLLQVECAYCVWYH